MPANCSACKNRSNNGSKTTFHKFPAKDQECLKKWVAFVSKARGKGLWKPTVNSKLCSLHFEPDCFRHFNGRVYLNTGATPTVFDIPEHLLKGTRCARESDASSSVVVSPSPEREEAVFVPSAVEERAFDYEGNPLNSAPVKVAKLELSRLNEEQLRKALTSPAKVTPAGQRMSAEAKEADGKRPIIVHVTSLGNNEPSSRPSRAKRLPEKLRSGDFDSDFGEEHPKKAPRLSPNLDDTEAGISDDDDLGDESEDVDAPDLDEDEYEEGSDGESAEPATAYRSQAIKTAASDGRAEAAPKSTGGASAGTLVELCTQLDEQRTKNEELTKQLAKAKVVIENQNRNIEALEDVINNLRQRIVTMSKKCSASTESAEVSGETKE